ncbi:hypothetical protein HHL16_12120 [Pseudoflavitalea sp. G-6-1-2]|uniref:S41 family peptidase n=1 Tax=Pseudoflavitalea sp. G-6-1-2 TaxID=2728841 RepID=UPI00146B8533|nr:S41 family peptidase [Pseudoflavitalea sp. G-6-1-2]NML21627.1 hypothetical protein [Pseudoflavitalea sp. G-6-1-2]
MQAITKHILAILISAGALLSSCKKETAGPESGTPANFNELFDRFWSEMNSRYLFWDIDQTNWEAMRSKYAPIFATLDLNKTEDVKKSVGYFREMTAGLIDGHYYINFLHPALRDSIINPSRDRKQRMAGYHPRVSYASLVRARYLYLDYREGRDNTTDPSRQVYALTGTIGGDVLYFHCNSFFLYDAWTSTKENGVKPVLEQFFRSLSTLPPAIRGIIIDVRGNTGGDISDINFLMGRLTNRNVQFGFTRYKNGAGRLDFTPWVPSYIRPLQGSAGVSVPVIALADNFSASLAESVTLAVKQLPGGKFIGETTWGANGPYAFNEQLYNAGPFKLTGFMEVQTSSAAFKTVDGTITEGQGVVPDIPVPFDRAAIEQGQDVILQTALDQLRKP